MKPVKAGILFLYCLVALVIVGTAFSHFWRTNKELHKTQRLMAMGNPLEQPAAPTEVTP